MSDQEFVKAKYPDDIAIWVYDRAFIIESTGRWSAEISSGCSSKKLAWADARRRLEEK